MSPLLFLLCFCVATLAAARTAPELFRPEEANVRFEQFIQKYNKQYANEEEKQARLKIFKENLERANVLNQESEHAVFGITKFSDLTPDEFIEHFTGLGVPTSNTTAFGCADVSDGQIPNYDAPASYDWRQNNAVTRVKFQGRCGSCYAFSASGNIEGQYAMKHGQLIEFSEQQTVDCDKSSNGCKGGIMAFAFRSMIQLGGIEKEADYPYVARVESCQFSQAKVAATLASCTTYNVVSQDKVKQIVYKTGPLAVAVKAANFQFYVGGIMWDKQCNYGKVNHAVLLVGYGVENGEDYWILKNSWDVDFGENGYIRTQRGESASSCGMINNGFMTSSTII